MKQHITVEQLVKLNGCQYEKLYKLIDNNYDGYMKYTYQDASELVTIGKMIEILSNVKQIEEIQGGKWWVRFLDNSLKVKAYELTDALFEAIKVIL